MKSTTLSHVISVPGNKPDVKRRAFGRLVIKRPFQMRFSLIVFSLFSLLVFFNWVVGSATIKRMVEMGLVSNDQFLVQLNILNNVIVKSSALGLIFLYGACLFFSHSIAGPIYRLEQLLGELGSGKLNLHFRVRRLDEFSDVADVFSRSIKNLRQRLLDDQTDRSDIIKEISHYANLLRKKGLRKEAGALEKMVSELGASSTRISL